MIKLLIFTLSLTALLSATVVTQSQRESIYIEGILFVTVFGIMSIVSYIYSTKQAKAYKSPKKLIPEKMIGKVQTQSRVFELTQMLKNGILTPKEFELLKNYYLKN